MRSHVLLLAGLLSAACLSAAGCGKSAPPPAASDNKKTTPAETKRVGPTRQIVKAAAQEPQAKPPAHREPPASLPPRWPERNLGDLLPEGQRNLPPGPQPETPPDPATAPPEVPLGKVEAAGIHKLEGQHLTLYTDVPLTPAIEELPQVFDAALPQWCAYFELDTARFADWHVTGYLMKDKTAFEGVGLVPENLPPFLHGFASQRQVWLHEQESDYYRRHLLLHEGTHAFMYVALGSYAPAWYMEGTAELLATHRWQNGVLTMNVFPPRNEAVPLWGRVKIVRDAFAEHRALGLQLVFDLDGRAHQNNEAYGWSWAAAAFFDGHPRYRERFRQLDGVLAKSQFINQFADAVTDLYRDDWPEINHEWQFYISSIDYGYDLERAAIDFRPGEPLPVDGKNVQVAADRGWQSSGVLLEAGQTYRLQADGRFVIARTDRPWPCEPNGVTLRYYQGRPLGQLLGAVRSDTENSEAPNPFLNGVFAIGLKQDITPAESGTLYLRVNDSPAELAENEGACTVQVVNMP